MGLNTGASDGQRGQSYNPQRSRTYKNASTQAFREGFVHGYDQAIGNTLATETSATTTTATATMASEAFLAELESVECLDSANRTLNPKCRDTTSRHSLL